MDMQEILENYNQIYNEIDSLHQQNYDNSHIHLALIELDFFIREAKIWRDNIDLDPHFMFSPKGKEIIDDLIQAMENSQRWLEMVNVDEDCQCESKDNAENCEFCYEMTDEEINNIKFDFPQRKDG